VVVFDKNGRYLSDFGQKQLDRPVSVSVMKGAVYVADLALQKIQVFTWQGTFRETLIASGENKEVGAFIPTAVTVDHEEGLLFFTDAAWHRVVVLDREGNFRFSFGSSGSGQGEFLYPNGIVLDAKKNIYVADSSNGRIQVFSPDGKEVIRVITGSGEQGSTFALPRGMAVDKSGKLWVVDSLAHNVSVFNDDRKLFSFGKLGTEQGEFYFPNTVALDSAGRIYVTERGMNRVSVFTLSGNPLVR
jgi:DNA-binding beta-propeller fold protein YncE